jgi:glycerol-3-phosphate dehydrogenase
LVTIAGGKFTTYRVMAEDVVNEASLELAERVPESVTDEIPLVGAAGYETLWTNRERVARESGLSVDTVERLLHRYGSAIEDLIALIEERPELGEPLEGAPGYLAVEASYAASHEGALHLDDVLTRRTKISIEEPDRGLAAALPVAKLLAEVLGWDDASIERELDHYRARVAAERDSQTQPDDRTADATRMGAADVRTLAWE